MCWMKLTLFFDRRIKGRGCLLILTEGLEGDIAVDLIHFSQGRQRKWAYGNGMALRL
jgi:hypothetical protein